MAQRWQNDRLLTGSAHHSDNGVGGSNAIVTSILQEDTCKVTYLPDPDVPTTAKRPSSAEKGSTPAIRSAGSTSFSVRPLAEGAEASSVRAAASTRLIVASLTL